MRRRAGRQVTWRIPLILLAAFSVGAGEPKEPAPLYTEGAGTNPDWKTLIANGTVIVGSGKGKPIAGTKIDVNSELLESNMDEVKGTLRPGSIHTHVRSGIRPNEFEKWSRWYQEDGNTQIFRLFKGEQSVRSKDNIKAGRVEAFKTFPLPKDGEWIEWQGTYTIAEPGHGCIFQIMVGEDPETGQGGLWPVHLNQGPNGSLSMTRRRPKGAEKKTVVFAENVVGKNVSVKVRFDGMTTYKVFKKIHGRDEGFSFVGKGTYHKNCSDKVGLRWGIYQGSKPGSTIKENCMLFVTGVQVSYVKDSGEGQF